MYSHTAAAYSRPHRHDHFQNDPAMVLRRVVCQPEKRKVDSSILSLTTSPEVDEPSSEQHKHGQRAGLRDLVTCPFRSVG